MAMIRRLLIVSLLATLFAAFPVGSASACSCVMLDVDQALADYHAAFVGTIVDRPVDGNLGFEEVPYTFAVEQWVKGDFGDEFIVFSADNGAACGFEIAAGQSAGIFVMFDDGRAHGGLCSTTDAASLLAVAGDEPFPTPHDAPPSASPSDPPSGSGGDPDQWAFILFPTVAVLGLAYLVGKKVIAARANRD